MQTTDAGKLQILSVDLRELTQDELRDILIRRGFARFSSSQIFNWVYKRRVEDFSLMTDLSKALRKHLSDGSYFSRLTLMIKRVAKDKTTKFLFQLKDGATIETVFIPEAKRNTLCISTQVGCRFRCRFCASGFGGFKRDLSCAEIVNQFLFVQDLIRPQSLSNVVFMGVGEPLDNFDNLIKAIKILMDSKGIYLGKRKICISTAGIVPQIKKLADLKLGVRLSVSLHAADDHTRSKLMPINKKYPLKELMKALRYFVRINDFPITFEYILIRDLNTSEEDACELAHLVKNIRSKINLIAYNPSPHFDWQAPRQEQISQFTSVLKAKGVFFTLRKSRGQDIQAACGQLRSEFSLT